MHERSAKGNSNAKRAKAVQQKSWRGLGGDEGFIRGDIDVYQDA